MALNGNDLKPQQKRLKSFIIVHSGYHNDQILNFKTDDSPWGSGHYFFAEWSWCTKIYSWTAGWV